MKHTRHDTKVTAAVFCCCVSFILVMVYFATVFKNVLDFLLAVWTVFFLILLSVCITAVIAVLLYDYFVSK